MYKPHSKLNCPSDDTVVWRYLSFPKFMSLLETEALWFARVDLLEDPWEGAYTKSYVNKWLPDGIDASQAERNLESLHASFEYRRTLTVNCWHVSRYESAAMWKLYGDGGYAIGIRSTIGRMKEAFKSTEEQIFIGQVEYLDYDEDDMPTGNVFYPIVHKRKSFAHEQEVRAICWMVMSKTATWKEDEILHPNEVGLSVHVDLGELIDSVHIRPSSKQWVIELTSAICRRYGMENVPVIRSRIDEPYLI